VPRASLPWAGRLAAGEAGKNEREGIVIPAADVYKIWNYTHSDHAMRTNIDIDDALMRSAMSATGLKTKRGVVEEGLRLLVRLKQQEKIRAVRGKYRWEGDLSEMRQGRAFDARRR
jgi:Arc/MetJ family transcription regulator